MDINTQSVIHMHIFTYIQRRGYYETTWAIRSIYKMPAYPPPARACTHTHTHTNTYAHTHTHPLRILPKLIHCIDNNL